MTNKYCQSKPKKENRINFLPSTILLPLTLVLAILFLIRVITQSFLPVPANGFQIEKGREYEFKAICRDNSDPRHDILDKINS